MKNIKHLDATSVADAITKLAVPGSAPIAGGTDLIPIMRSMLHQNTPDTVVNLKTIHGLDYIRLEGDRLKIGALTNLDTISKDAIIREKFGALAQAARKVGTPQIRNMGTIAGNTCQETRCWYFRVEHNQFDCRKKNRQGECFALKGDNRYHSVFGAVNGCLCVNPGDIAPALMAFGTTVVTSKRKIEITDFFDVRVAPDTSGMTKLAEDEIVTEFQIQAPVAEAKSAFYKFAFRKAIDFAIVNCAAVIGNGRASICLNAVAGTPRKAIEAETLLAGQEINDTLASTAANATLSNSTSLSKNAFIIPIAKTILKRTILSCR